MKLLTNRFVISLFIACAAVMPAQSAKPRFKGEEVKLLEDGRFEITVAGKAWFPSGSQVVVVNLRDKLEAAAARACPGGYHLHAEQRSSFGAAPDGNGLVARLTGVARCKQTTQADVAE